MRRGVRVILAYVLWLLSAALSLLAVLQLRRFLLIDVPVVTILDLNPWMPPVIHYVGLFLLATMWLAFIAFSETYFHRWLEDKKLRLNIVKVFAAEAVIIGLAYAGHHLVTG